MKYFLLAGEASGDLHGSALAREIKLLDSEARLMGWGGDLMKKEGVTIGKHYKELAFMGFTEVVMNIRTIISNFKLCKSQIDSFQPDVVILIDYPGFNLRIAKSLRVKGIKTVYYISPQIWAWKSSRLHQIKRDIDKVFVILPFEKEFYHKHGMEVEFVGHPLLDALSRRKYVPLNDFTEKNNLDYRPIIALLPGSRKQEIKSILPIMQSVLVRFPAYQFVIAGAPSISNDVYNKYTGGKIPVIYGQTYQLIENSKAALVTSGTASLETALIGTPQVICYKAGSLSYFIARQLVKIKYIGLPNLILDKPIVSELIQHQLNTSKLIAELEKIINDTEHRDAMLNHYNILRKVLGGNGASAKTAGLIFRFLKTGE